MLSRIEKINVTRIINAKLAHFTSQIESTPVIPALGRLKQEDYYKIEISLSYNHEFNARRNDTARLVSENQPPPQMKKEEEEEEVEVEIPEEEEEEKEEKEGKEEKGEEEEEGKEEEEKDQMYL